MRGQLIAPRSIAEGCGPFRRLDEVCEEHRCQDAVRNLRGVRLAEKLLDLGRNLLADERRDIWAWHADRTGVWNRAGNLVRPFFGATRGGVSGRQRGSKVLAVQQECRCANRWEHSADVRLRDCAYVLRRRCWA